jgi:hypothetical protein
MRYFLLIGGFTGFLIGFTACLLAGNPPADAFLRGAAGCLAGALLLRVLHLILMTCLRTHIETLAARQQTGNSEAPADRPTQP